jgi:hypothetical protein
MKIEEAVMFERERCKQIVRRKIEGVIQSRIKNVKGKRRRHISVFEKLKDNILFKIDNPNYIRLKDRK